MSAERVVLYVDGFNLYFGLRAARWRKYLWLNIQQLGQNLLKSNQELVFTKYFTARISGPSKGDRSLEAKKLAAKRKRQSDYLEALQTLTDFQVFEGHYLSKNIRCRSCGAAWPRHEEKMTDVNIATEILTDAFRDAYDTALLISADSDLVPPVLAVRDFSLKNVLSLRGRLVAHQSN